MTGTELETAARNRLNATGSDFWSSSEILTECLYSALVDLAKRVKCVQNTRTLSSVASQAEYTYSTSVMETKHLTYDGRPLSIMDWKTYESMNLALSVATVGTPTHFLDWDGQYILYPTPGAVGVDNIKARTIDLPVTPTGAATPEPPLWMHPKLITGTAYYMLLKEAEDPRIPAFKKFWDDALQWCETEWRLKSRAQRYGRVKREEDLLCNDTGII